MINPLIIFLLLFGNLGEATELAACAAESLGNLDLECSQSEREPTDGIGGWVVECHPGIPSKTFRLEFSLNKNLIIECGERQLLFRGLFPDCFRIKEISKLELIDCILSNVSLNTIFASKNVKELKIVDVHNVTFLQDYHFEDSSTITRLELEQIQLGNVDANIFTNLLELKSLAIRNNSLAAIPKDWFAEMPNLTSLEISTNQISALQEHIFEGLENLKELRLPGNQIKEIHPLAFTNLTMLKILDLSDNHLKDIPELVFDPLVSVSSIYINSNYLETLPNTLFANNINLEELVLSYNPIFNELPQDLLKELKILKKVSIKKCNLNNIHEMFFSNNPLLQEVRLWNNRLSTLPAETFLHNEDLKIIDITFNQLEHLPEPLFQSQIKLQSLILSANNLTELPQGLFNQTAALKDLRIDRNNLKTLDGDVFKRLNMLTELDLNTNEIESIEGELPFGNGVNLRVVNLSNNRIKKFPAVDWNMYRKLETINFINNKISTFSVPPSLPKGLEIHLQHNKISSVILDDIWRVEDNAEASAKQTHQANSIFLSGNPFRCDCNLLQFYEYIVSNPNDKYYSVNFRNAKDLQCSSPEGLKSAKLTSMRREEFACPVKEGCPERCRCYLRGHDQALVANCSRLQLESLPDTAPPSTSILDLSHNNISSLDLLNQRIWQNLTQVNLDNNELESSELGPIPRGVQELFLRNNKLSWLSGSLQNLTQQIPNIQLYLGGNPWKCSDECKAQKLKSWLTENYKNIKDIPNINCSDLRMMTAKGNIYMQVTMIVYDACTEDKPDYVALVIGGCILVLVSALLVLAVAYYRNRLTIMAYIYIHFYNLFICFYTKDDLDEDKIYDAFVSYSTADRDLALALITELEPAFKLCIHERDWLPGNLISWNILNSVQNSRKTILIVSRDFVESVWFQVEFHTAYYQMLEDKVYRLVVVVRGELPTTLDADLRTLLATKTYLVWDERWFWEKLRYVMPKGRHRRPPPPVASYKPKIKHLAHVESEIASLSQAKAHHTTLSRGCKIKKPNTCTVVDTCSSTETPSTFILSRV